MKFLLLLATVFIFLLPSDYCFALSQEELAGRIIQADKEVRSYQEAKANGTYVDYSVTPTWVTVLWSVIGIGILAAIIIAFVAIKSVPPELVKVDNSDSGSDNSSTKPVSDADSLNAAILDGTANQVLEKMLLKSMDCILSIYQNMPNTSEFMRQFFLATDIKEDHYGIYLNSTREVLNAFPTMGLLALRQLYYFELFEIFRSGKSLDRPLRATLGEVLIYSWNVAQKKEDLPGPLMSNARFRLTIGSRLQLSENPETSERYLFQSMEAAEAMATLFNGEGKKLSANRFYKDYVVSVAPVFYSLFQSFKTEDSDQSIRQMMDKSPGQFLQLQSLFPIIQAKLDSDQERKRMRAEKKNSLQ